jgi:putative Mn2+ efflux pump MntP
MQFINLLGQNDDKIVISYAVQSESFYRCYISLTLAILIDDLLITVDLTNLLVEIQSEITLLS